MHKQTAVVLEIVNKTDYPELLLSPDIKQIDGKVIPARSSAFLSTSLTEEYLESNGLKLKKSTFFHKDSQRWVLNIFVVDKDL